MSASNTSHAISVEILLTELPAVELAVLDMLGKRRVAAPEQCFAHERLAIIRHAVPETRKPRHPQIAMAALPVQCIIDRRVRLRAQQHALTALHQLHDRLRDLNRLARTGRPLKEAQVGRGQNLDHGFLLRFIERLPEPVLP